MFKDALDLSDNLDIYYLALMIIMTTRNGHKNDIVELSLVLDEDNLERFIEVFEGRTITIPTKKSFSLFIKSVLVLYYKQQGFTQHMLYKKANVTPEERQEVWRLVKVMESKITEWAGKPDVEC